MKLVFLGAAHEVTGSCYYLEAAGKKFLVDCGMEQGPNHFENKPIPIPEAELDFVLLTHAHIDHSGNLPLLYAKGYRGPVYMTAATADLCDIMLRDSAHIQMFEAEWRNRKAKRAGQGEYIPAYTVQDALGIVSRLQHCPYGEKQELYPGISVRFVDAGHLLGSASIEIWLTEPDPAAPGKGLTKKLVFSGDIGNLDQPLIKNPTYLTEADYVIMESTYGDRSHGEVPDYVEALADVIQKTFDQGGNVVIPSFAVGRTQEMLYFIRQIKQNRMITGHPNFPVYVDSPLAVEATGIFQKHHVDCFDEQAAALVNQGINPIRFPGLKLSISSEESKAINELEQPKVIISASGMCDAGRIKHHLKHNLWRRDSTILFVGYQAVGTIGRSLVEGATTVKLFGEEIQVQANIQVLPGISGHADNAGLMNWASSFVTPLTQVFVTHGEDQTAECFAERLRKELHYEAMAPYSGTSYDLAAGEFLEITEGIPVPLKTTSQASARKATVFERLLAAGQRLLTVIRKNEGVSNKDLSKFTDQINNLCEKWDR